MKNRKRNRMKGFDYSSNNLYFVTICVQDMVCCLGNIIPIASEGAGLDLPVSMPAPEEKSQKIILNRYGSVVKERLIWLEQQYEYVILHNFVVMPNHVHAIIEIDSLKIKNRVQIPSEQMEIKIKSLSSLIGAFKTTASKKIHELGYLKFSWQRSFHDHIIRDEKAYTNINNYIHENPDKWEIESLYQ